MFQLGNGCICCSVKGELVRVLENILQRDTVFDHIIIETTGLANPGPVAAEFWVDRELESKYYLDAVITVVDAKHLVQHLDDELRGERDINEAERQLGKRRCCLLAILMYDFYQKQHLLIVFC